MNSKYKKIIIVLVILIVILLIVFLFSKNDNILTPINPEYSIELLGEKEITIDQYSEYSELGFSAYYGNKNVNSDVTIESNIDSNVPGTYEVKYIVGDREASRQITVTPIEEDTSGVTGDALIAVYYEISDCELTNDDVLIDFKIVGKDYKQSIMPDDSCSTNNTFTYKIKENGKYDFSFYDINENKKELTLEIDNIDKDIPNGTCEIKKANGNYVLNVESTKYQLAKERAERIAIDASLDNKKVEKEVAGLDGGKAKIFNENDGGGAKYEYADGAEAYVGVNCDASGAEGMMAQIYADVKDESGKWVGSRINVYNDKIYYQSKENTYCASC